MWRIFNVKKSVKPLQKGPVVKTKKKKRMRPGTCRTSGKAGGQGAHGSIDKITNVVVGCGVQMWPLKQEAQAACLVCLTLFAEFFPLGLVNCQIHNPEFLFPLSSADQTIPCISETHKDVGSSQPDVWSRR